LIGSILSFVHVKFGSETCAAIHVLRTITADFMSLHHCCRPAAEMIGIESGSDVDAAALKHDSSGESELDEGNDADPRADRQADATHSDQSDSDASEISSLPAETGSGAKRKPSRAGADEDSSGKRPKLSVEDDFLRMDDMEAFVQQAERQATAGSDGESGTRVTLDCCVSRIETRLRSRCRDWWSCFILCDLPVLRP
jgi:hypothetical protein